MDRKILGANSACLSLSSFPLQPNDVNLVDYNGRTALHLACQIGSVECVKALMSCPVYVIWILLCLYQQLGPFSAPNAQLFLSFVQMQVWFHLTRWWRTQTHRHCQGLQKNRRCLSASSEIKMRLQQQQYTPYTTCEQTKLQMTYYVYTPDVAQHFTLINFLWIVWKMVQ